MAHLFMLQLLNLLDSLQIIRGFPFKPEDAVYAVTICTQGKKNRWSGTIRSTQPLHSAKIALER